MISTVRTIKGDFILTQELPRLNKNGKLPRTGDNIRVFFKDREDRNVDAAVIITSPKLKVTYILKYPMNTCAEPTLL